MVLQFQPESPSFDQELSDLDQFNMEPQSVNSGDRSDFSMDGMTSQGSVEPATPQPEGEKEEGSAGGQKKKRVRKSRAKIKSPEVSDVIM